ncbi:MAG TPA: ABC transporter permease [Puia sp.]|jgi:predicted permease|nr:ABC transporter permease [Puia sp.]
MKEKMPEPPKWATRFLTWYCRPTLLEDLQGDLNEYFHRNVRERGASSARLIYIIDVLKFFRPYIIRKPSFSNPLKGKITMKKQLLFTLRRLSRHKLTAGINILGLTLGILSCLVIFLYVSFEFSYDKFHADAGRIYRVIVSAAKKNGSHGSADMTSPLGPDLRRETSAFSAVTSLHTDDTRVLVPITGKPARVIPTIGDDERQHITFADSDYLKIFHYRWLAGNPATALQKPFSVVLTESEAQRYFQGGQPEDWMGRSIVYYDSLPVAVTGIVKDWDHNSDLGFRDLISYNTIEHSFLQKDMEGWNLWAGNVNVYVKLAPGTTPAQAEQQLPSFLQRHIQANGKAVLSLQPLADIHFNGEYADRYGRRAHKPTLYALTGIALFILVIAAINFINLSTAQSILRAREVGVRKVLGSSRGSLVRQFLNETGIIVTSAMVLALLLANPTIRALHGFIPEGVRLHIGDVYTWIFAGSTILVTCLLAGWYPARAISSFLPVITLRGQGVQQLNSKSYLRKSLIVFQFTVSLIFIIGTMMVGRQIRYMLNTDLGFKKDAIVTIGLPWDQPKDRKIVLATGIRRLAGVQEVSVNTGSPEAASHGGTGIEYNGKTHTKIDAGFVQIDPDYIPLYELALVAGRNFTIADTARRGSDPASGDPGPAQTPFRAFILNETAARALGFNNPADAVGQQVSSGFSGIPGPVVGVVRDFHSQNLHEKIQPFFFTEQRAAGGTLSIKLSSATLPAVQVKTLMTELETSFKKIYPASVFQARFFDESLARLYRQEQQTAEIMNIAMGIAIFISCMGLFGLAAFTANQRTREIGIRKVLGANVPQLVSMLSRQFILLVMLSTLIAAPIAGWGMHMWLEDFAYQTSMPWWIYVVAGAVAVAIALVTVSFQAIRAAMANPVRSLRSE